MTAAPAVRTAWVACVLATVAAGGLIRGEPAPAQEDERLQALAGSDASARAEARRRLTQAGAPALPGLLSLMDQHQGDTRKAAFDTAFHLVQRAAGSSDQRDVAATLCRELRTPHSVHTRRAICEFLSYVGDDASLQALYPLLGDAPVQEMARFAIARIPGPGATLALAGALQIAERPFLLGIVNALAERADPAGLPALSAAAQHGDAGIRRAAWDGLARLPGRASLDVLTSAVQQAERGTIDALLKLADIAGARGDTAIPQAVLEVLADRPDLNSMQRLRLVNLRIYSRQDALGSQAIGDVLAREWREGRRAYGLVLELLIQLPGDGISREVRTLLEPARRASILADAPGLTDDELQDDLGYVLKTREEESAGLAPPASSRPADSGTGM